MSKNFNTPCDFVFLFKKNSSNSIFENSTVLQYIFSEQLRELWHANEFLTTKGTRFYKSLKGMYKV
jgi:hypothetical protein